MAASGPSALLSALREQVARIEGHGAGQARPVVPFGIPALDGGLPQGGLACGALHEVAGAGANLEHASAAALLVAGILARAGGPVLWVSERFDLFAPALAAVGLPGSRVIHVEAGRAVLLAREEGLRHPGLAGVVGEYSGRLDLTASRRLQLAAEASGALAFLIRRGGVAGSAARHGVHPGGEPGDLCDDPARRHARQLPDREPGADGHAAQDAAPDLLRPGHPGRHRPPRPDPGRHGASLPAPPGGAGAGPLPEAGTAARAWQDAGRAAVPGAGDAGRHPLRRVHPLRGRPASPLHGDLQGHRRRLRLPGEAGRRHGGARLHAGLRRAHLRAVGGLWQLWLSREPRASFALIAYASAWVKCHHPAVFCAALLNSQPMGFYAPAQVVRDAREHGVAVRPVCVNASRWDCTLEPAPGSRLAVRLGLRLVKGLTNADAARLVAHLGEAPYRSIEEVWRRAGLPPAALERLAEADGFGALGVDRRQALWAVRGLADHVLPLFAAADRGRVPEPEIIEAPVRLAALREGQQVVEDYRSTGLSLRGHPLAFLRRDLAARGMVSCGELASLRDGQRIALAGLVLVRQKPGSAKGVLFITVEDETGVANLIVWPSVFEQQRRVILSAGLLGCRGRVQREGEVLHVIVKEVEDLTAMLQSVAQRDGSQDDAAGQAAHRARDIAMPDLRLGAGIKVPTRDFR